MKAHDAVDGKEYFIRRRNAGYDWQKALCQGWNGNHTWILFLIIDGEHKRKILTVLPTEEIKEKIL